MVKTTIDGLAVRKSPKRRVVEQSTAKKSSTSLGSPAPHRRAARAAKPTRRESTRAAVDNEFLQPIQELDFGEVGTDFGAQNEADWSDLLDEISSQKPAEEAPSKLDPLLDDWGAEDELEEEPKKPKRTPHKKRRKVLCAVLVILLVVIIGGGIVAGVWGDQIISRLTGGRSGLWSTISAMVSEEVIPFETDLKGRTNVLVFGTEGYDMAGSVGNGTHDGATLTDSIMVISFDQETKDVALLSIPRDLKVSSACMVGKINEVFTCHNENGTNEEAGAQALMKQVGQVLDVDFQYWAHVNWGSLIQIIDTLGGITVTLDEDIADYGYTGVVAQAGVPITLNGEQALGLARARHGTNGGDFTRGNSQQKIVEGIIQRGLEKGVGVTEAFDLLNILGDNLRTNFSTDLVKSGLKLAKGFSIDKIRQVPLADYENNIYYVGSETINGVSYVMPKGTPEVSGVVRLQNYVREMFSSDPIMREHPTLAIFNATDKSGVAGAEGKKLEAEGYEIKTIGDADMNDCYENYCLYDMSGENPATAEVLAATYGVAMRPAAELPTDIWPAGADFVIVIGQVAE